MSRKPITPYSESLDWIYDQQTKIERARYGKNRKSVEDAVEEQRHKAGVIADFKKQLDKALAQTPSEEDKSHLIEAYEKLMDTSQKKINCLNTMLDITSLEEYCGNISHEFDVKAVTMVSPEEREKQMDAKGGNQIPGFVSPSSHDCVFAVQDNWKWIARLVDCIQIHLKNASTYHQFFHDVDEAGQWLVEDLKRLHDTFELTPIKGDKKDAEKLCRELDEIVLALKQWETKSNFMWETAVKVVPVNLRTEGITEPTPIRAIADYETETISIRDGEDLLLLDNTRTNMWKVRNCRGQEDYIPALACLIPGPTKDAIDAAIKLRLQLLAAWTATLKRIGKRLIAFMLMVFKPVYDEDEINVLKSIEDLDKADLLRILDFIENTLRVHWQDHEGFVALQERVLALRMILEEAGDKPLDAIFAHLGASAAFDASVCKALVVQVTVLERMMDKYKDLWQDWEKYKVALESSQAPELMLICDKWEQLKYVSREYFSKFWKTELPFDELEKSIAGLKSLTIGSTSIEDTSVADSGTEMIDGQEDLFEFIVPEKANREYSAAPEWPGDNVHRTDYKTTATYQSTIGQGPRSPGANGSHEEIIQATRAPLQQGAPMPGQFGIGTEVTMNRSGSLVSKAGRVVGRQPKANESYGIEEDFIINSRSELVTRDGRTIGHPPKEGERFGIETEFIITTTGEYVTKSGKLLGRRPTSSDYSTNARGQYVLKNGVVLDHAPDSGEYFVNEYGEFVDRHGRVIGMSMNGFGDNYQTSSDTEVSRRSTTVTREVTYGRGGRHGSGSAPVRRSSRLSSSGSEGQGVHEAITAETVSTVQSARTFNGGMHTAAEEGSEGFESIEEHMFVTETGLEEVQAVSPGMVEAGQFGYASETKTAESEEIRHQEQEVNKTFIIQSVTDPRDQTEISLQQAILAGVINPETGSYVNPDTGESKLIPTAMNEGLIRVSFTTTKRSAVKKSSVGIITLKTLREKIRPFKIVTVKNTKTNADLSEREAIKQGVIDDSRVTFTDKTTGKQVLIADAIRANLVEVEYTGPEPEPEVVAQQYAVRAVVDTLMKKVITFNEAVRRGIIDRDTGSFKDTATGKTMYVGDAIMRGFLKARKLDDASGLDIDPQNRVVVDKTESIRKKLLKPLSVISAFRKAAAVAKRN